jgi:hypothetical protein
MGMLLVLTAIAWAAALLFVAALCRAASVGDLMSQNELAELPPCDVATARGIAADAL